MIQSGYVFFDPDTSEDANLAPMNTNDHKALCLISRKVYFGRKQATAPTAIHLGMTGYTGFGPNVRIKFGVVGTATYQCATDVQATQSPDGEGFYIAISVDATCQTDSLQIAWLAIWD
jgi:hypothetical protein